MIKLKINFYFNKVNLHTLFSKNNLCQSINDKKLKHD